MNNIRKYVVVAAALAGFAGVSHADVIGNGSTGLMGTPSSNVVAKGAADVALDFSRYSHQGYREYQGGLAGAVGVADGLELSGAYHRVGGDGHANLWDIGAKYQIRPYTRDSVGLGIGAGYNKTSGGGHRADVYAAATAALNPRTSNAVTFATLGVRYNNYGGGEDKVDVFSHLSVPLTPSGSYRFGLGLGTKRRQGAKDFYLVGLRYQPGGKGPVNYGVSVGRHSVAIKADYTFGR